jgi:hypothetical protein
LFELEYHVLLRRFLFFALSVFALLAASLTPQDVPTGLFEPCTSLYYLKLTSNAISTFPIIPSLRELHIGYNEIELVPESIGEMASLTVLNLEGNRLSFLPASLANLKNLRSVLIGALMLFFLSLSFFLSFFNSFFFVFSFFLLSFSRS